MAIVGSVLGTVGTVLGSPVKSRVKLMTSSAMVARIRPSSMVVAQSRPIGLLRAMVRLCNCCCVAVISVLIVALVSVSAAGTVAVVVAVTVAVVVKIVGGSMMWAVVGWQC